MSVKLNQGAYAHAVERVRKQQFVDDGRDDWSEHQPSTQQENDFIRQHGFEEYAKWHLGIDEDENENTKGRYKFPYGDFENIHRCAVLTIESRAGQYKYHDIQNAAAHLHGMIDVSAG
ncbi:MAG: hypothetical protein V4632_08410 [Pseudomonadota bacterium]